MSSSSNAAGGRAANGTTNRGKKKGNKQKPHGIKSGMTVEDLKRLTQARMGSNSPAGSPVYKPGISPPLPPAPPLPPGPPPPPKSAPAAMTMDQLRRMTHMRLHHPHHPPPHPMQYSPNHMMMMPPRPPPPLPPTPPPPPLPPTTTATARAAAASAERIFKARQASKSPPPPPPQPPSINTTTIDTTAPSSSGPLSPRGAQVSQLAAKFREGLITQSEFTEEKERIIHESMTASSAAGLHRAPSWSPATSRKAAASSSPAKSPSKVASFYHRGNYEKANNEQNNVVAPPPGMLRRPSMTVPWQVAESVFDTLQASNNETNDSSVNNSSTSGPASAPSAFGRRSSFGNAAQFFRHRRRSKGRLDIGGLSDLSSLTEHMPGISESPPQQHQKEAPTNVDDEPKNPFFISNASSEVVMKDSPSMGPIGKRQRDLRAQQEEEKEVTAPNSPFQASTFRGAPSLLEIPPTNEDEFSSSLPLMSPNGEKLRKVAMLARRGSLSMADKDRAKDEIIQNSMAATSPPQNVALIGKLKLKMSDRLTKARKSIEIKASDAKKFGQMAAAAYASPRQGEDSPRAKSASRASPMSRSPNTTRSPPPGFAQNSKTSAIEERLAAAAQRVAACITSSDKSEFAAAMAELDKLKAEASTVMESKN